MRAGPKGDHIPERLDLGMLPASGARRVAAFAEEFLTVPTGKGAAGPFRLRPWQKRVVGSLLPTRGARPRQGVLSLPRGNGKTSLAAVLGAYALLADGVENAEVLVVASDQRQAGITLRKVVQMIAGDPRLEEQVVQYTDRLAVPATGSTLAVLPAEPGACQGWDPSFAICDELHVGTRDVWDAVALAAGKRESSLVLAISTPGGSRDGVLWDLVEHGRAGTDPSFVLVEYCAPEGCDLDDEGAWAAANPALGDFLFVDALRATLKTTNEREFRRYRLGQWPLHAETWLPLPAWQACADPRRIPDGASVVLAVDGSHAGDVAALVAAQVGEAPHLELIQLWEPPAGAVEYQVPVAEVEDAIAQACERYTAKAVNADPYRWSRVLQQLRERGLPAVEFPQTAARMSPATQKFSEAVYGELLTHSGDPDLTRHVMAASVRAGERGLRIAKGTGRIDAAVCAIMAHSGAAETRINVADSVW